MISILTKNHYFHQQLILSNIIAMNLRIRTKMLALILSVLFVIYSTAISYISLKAKNKTVKDAIELTNAYASEAANKLTSELNVDIDISRGLAQSFMGYAQIPQEQRKDIYTTALKNVLIENPNFLSVWSNWELWAWDNNWNSEHGRLRLTYWRENGQVKYKEEIIDTIAKVYTGAYYDARVHKGEGVMNPYYYSYSKLKADEILETSVFASILENGQFVGMAGIDLALSRFEPLVKDVKLYQNDFAMLLANDGSIVAHHDEELIGEKVQEIYPDIVEQYKILSNIQEGKSFSFEHIADNEEEFYYSFVPIKIGNTTTPWSIGIVIPMQEVMYEAKTTFRNVILLGILGLLIMGIVVYIIAYRLTLPLNATTLALNNLADGDIENENKIYRKYTDEIGLMNNSLNKLIDNLNAKTIFAREIGEGKLDTEFESQGDKDLLGRALIDMRNSLKQSKIAEIERKENDRKQNWATQGMAKFADILRMNFDNMEDFGYEIISNLVKYVNASQGGLFVLNDDDHNNRYYEMLACYAYNRRKFLEKQIEEGVGLIGRCALEAQSILLKEIPNDYIEISSGLGKENPKVLLLVPLKMNEDVYGVIEIASFVELEQYQIDFIERIGESIASTISSTKINIRTQKLLEESRMQAEELAAQEEEMRQNMEELQATQEEAARKSQEMEGLLNAINSAAYVMEYDLDGKIININEAYLKLFGAGKNEFIGSYDREYNSDMDEAEYKELWDNLKQGKIQKRTLTMEHNDNGYTFLETFTPIHDGYGDIVKIMKIATDVSEYLE